MSEIKLGIYRHYKGALKEVLGVGKHSETEEELVFYKTVATGELWVRPVTMFLEEVEVDGVKKPRFEYLYPARASFLGGAFGLIVNEENKILLCHRCDVDLWNLPGGGVEQNEAPWQAVVREVKEETGLDVEVLGLVGVYFKPNNQENNFAFSCKIISGQLTLNNEADKIEYFGVDELPEKISPKQKERIQAYFKTKESGSVFMKIQDSPSTLDLLKQNKL